MNANLSYSVLHALRGDAYKLRIPPFVVGRQKHVGLEVVALSNVGRLGSNDGPNVVKLQGVGVNLAIKVLDGLRFHASHARLKVCQKRNNSRQG